MRVTWRDWVATGCVAVAAVMYTVWLSQDEVLGISGARGVGVVVLLLGLAASVTAVVFGVGEGLLHANKLYLGLASVLGLAALVTGIIVLVSQSETMLATLVASTVVLWLLSTVRHAMGERGSHQAGAIRGATAT